MHNSLLQLTKMKIILTLGLTTLGLALLAQNNSLVINNNAFVVINGGSSGNEAVMVIDQPHANGIITSGTGGNIITQSEFDYVKWNVRTSTGNHVVPFTTDVGNVKIPLSINLTGAGTGSGYLALSTWDVSAAAGQFNNAPWPSDVTHMAGANGVPDNSDYAVDRFWVIDVSDPLGTGETYSTIPTPSLSFVYNTAAAEVGDGNNLTVGQLGAQHFDPVGNNWHGAGAGVSATGIWGADNGAGLVSGVVPPAGEWFRTWTLSDYSSPLPVDLAYFQTDCKDQGVVVSWQTLSEINNDYFDIQKSYDGISFESIGTIQGNNNSSQPINYQYIDEQGNLIGAVYRLVQINYDGSSNLMGSVTAGACVGEGENVNIYTDINGHVLLDWSAVNDGEYDVIIYDGLGKQITAPERISVEKGNNKIQLNIKDVAFGNYMVQISGNNQTIIKKFVMK